MPIFVIIGSFIGAGFASGQEIYLFFYKFGINGILGLILCSLLIGIIIYKTLKIILEKNIENYNDFLLIIFKNKKITKFINIIIDLFLLFSFFIMTAGFGAYLEQEFKINKLIGVLFFLILIFIILLKDISGIKKINNILIPILIIFILIICKNNLEKNKINYLINNLIENNSQNFWWIIQSIIYCSYNMILIIPILINFKKYIKNKKEIKYISIFSGLIIFILAISIFLLLINIKEKINLIEMPAVYVIGKKFPEFKLIYGLIIIFSIFTTAISTGISFLKNTIKSKKSFPQYAAIMCITSLIISNFGFLNLVKILFPVFGYFGLIQIIYILKFELPRA